MKPTGAGRGYTALHRLRYESHHFQLIVALFYCCYRYSSRLQQSCHLMAHFSHSSVLLFKAQQGCELGACKHCCASQGVCTVLMHLQLPSFCSGVVVQSRIRCYSGYTALHRLRYESHHFQLIVARLLN